MKRRLSSIFALPLRRMLNHAPRFGDLDSLGFTIVANHNHNIIVNASVILNVTYSIDMELCDQYHIRRWTCYYSGDSMPAAIIATRAC